MPSLPSLLRRTDPDDAALNPPLSLEKQALQSPPARTAGWVVIGAVAAGVVVAGVATLGVLALRRATKKRGLQQLLGGD